MASPAWKGKLRFTENKPKAKSWEYAASLPSLKAAHSEGKALMKKYGKLYLVYYDPIRKQHKYHVYLLKGFTMYKPSKR